jgi:peptidyl-prolyl cis-trans isomerase D
LSRRRPRRCPCGNRAGSLLSARQETGAGNPGEIKEVLMLSALRRGASGWLAQLFIAVLVISFGVWGVADIFTGFRSDTVATVGKTDITIVEFQRQYEAATRELSKQFGQQLTNEQARAFGVPQQVLGRLVAEATLNDAARSLGLGISNQTLASQIADDPAFRGSTGGFDRGSFQQILRSAGFTEEAYLAQLRSNYVRQQIGSALIGATTAPDPLMRALHEYRNEARKISYVVVPATAAGGVGDPTETDLNAYFDARKADWRAPEYRAVTIMKMLPTDLAKPADVSDEDARKSYDSQPARWTTAEQRKVEQIVFKDRAEADQAAAALGGGKTFDDLLAERKLKPADVDLGLVTREKMIDPKIAEAAFGLAANTVSGVVDGRFGAAILRVTTVQPQVVKTFDEAKADLKQELADRRAVTEITDQHDMVEDARAGGQTLAEIAKKYGLKLIAIAALDKTGKDDKGNPVPDLPAGNEFLTGVFDTDVGIENAPLRIGDNGYAWYDVTGVTAARDRQLAEVRDKVVEAWKRSQVEDKLTAKANEIRDRLAKGEDIAKVAAELALEVKTADNVTRAMKPAGDLGAAAIQRAFAGPKGSAAVAAGVADQTKLVLVVTDATTPPYFSGAPDLAQSQDEVSQEIGNDILSQYIMQLQGQLGVALNQTALAQAVGRPGT